MRYKNLILAILVSLRAGISAYAGYRFCKLFQATIGYRYIRINYDKGEGIDRFLYDVDTYGPVVRLGVNF